MLFAQQLTILEELGPETVELVFYGHESEIPDREIPEVIHIADSNTRAKLHFANTSEGKNDMANKPRKIELQLCRNRTADQQFTSKTYLHLHHGILHM